MFQIGVCFFLGISLYMLTFQAVVFLVGRYQFQRPLLGQGSIHGMYLVGLRKPLPGLIHPWGGYVSVTNVAHWIAWDVFPLRLGCMAIKPLLTWGGI